MKSSVSHKSSIAVGDRFTVSKTDHVFVEVTFDYNDGRWEGCFPIHYPPRLIDYPTVEDAVKDIQATYEVMLPSNIDKLRAEADARWGGRRGESETYQVFKYLLSGQWSCRSCGVGKINDQPAARIRDIKRYGFVVATKTKYCKTCDKTQYHDVLLLCEVGSESKEEFRKPISPSMKGRIISCLSKRDAFFGSERPAHEFVIDHKFPSQRWNQPESDNDYLTDVEIKKKFQLLTNQTNMLKSRLCDQCVLSGARQGFLGINWYYAGGQEWREQVSGDPESGCVGCPWYDLTEWKLRAERKLRS